MATRALLTEREREVLSGTAGTDAYRSTVRSRVRARLDALTTDTELLASHEPELHDQLRDIIC